MNVVHKGRVTETRGGRADTQPNALLPDCTHGSAPHSGHPLLFPLKAMSGLEAAPKTWVWLISIHVREGLGSGGRAYKHR